jgi:hypothetical protein
MGTQWGQQKNKKFLPIPWSKNKKKARFPNCMLSLLIGCLIFLFPKLLVTILTWVNIGSKEDWYQYWLVMWKSLNMNMHNGWICMKLYSEVVQFLILVCTNNWQRGIEPLCISISILARFWEAWYSYSVTKGFGDCNYILCYITTHIRELGFRYSGDARYSFSLWKMGEWAL